MKRICCILLCVVLLLFSGCGNSTKASDKAVAVAESAIEVADNYLDNIYSYSEAYDKLSELKNQMAYVDEYDPEDEQKAADFFINTSLIILSSSILLDAYDSTHESYDKIIEYRNDLAKKAGLKER